MMLLQLKKKLALHPISKKYSFPKTTDEILELQYIKLC